MAEIDFAALLCSRLCHDLVSPVGAMNNGMEILADEDDPAMREQVLDLLNKSARQTSNKLQFFRLAFGSAGGFSNQLDLREAEKALRALFDGTRVALNWQVTLPSAHKRVVKLLLNVGMTLGESLIRGGELTVRLDINGSKHDCLIEAVGDRLLMSDEVLSALKGDLNPEALEPRTAPAYLVSQVVRDMGGNLSISENNGRKMSVRMKFAIAEA